MIDILEALAWLNWGRISEVSDPNKYWIDRIRDPGLPDAEKAAIIDSLVNSVQAMSRASEQAEILANCGAYGYKLNLMDEASRWLELAQQLYEYTHDIHRQAVTHWLRFIALRGQGRYQKAFDEARLARKLFDGLAEQSRVRKQASSESWYRARILDMTCDLVSSPEDMFEWMYEYHGTLLSPSGAQIKDRLAEYLEKRTFQRVDENMQLLLGIALKSKDPQEAGEALAYCGVIHWVLEDRTEAIQFFRSAMTQFIPGSHEYALVRWMLGLALFDIPAERSNAILHLEASIDYFRCLSEGATHENRMDRRDWYVTHHSAMKRVLRTKLSSVI